MDFQEKLIRNSDKTLMSFLKEIIKVDKCAIEKIGKSFDLHSLCKDLNQKQIDKLYRELFLEREVKVNENTEEMKEERVAKPKKERRKFYERWYLWFFTSDGFLVFRGKNIRQNLTIFRRFVKENDVLFFDKMENPIFTVLKVFDFKAPLPPTTLYEAAEFTCAYSFAWKEKIEKIPVFYTEAKSVRLDEKFLLSNVRKIEKIKPKLSIGIMVKDRKAKIIYGPPTAIKKFTHYLVTIVPGEKDAKILSKEIKNELLSKAFPEDRPYIEKINLKEIQKIIPYGKGELVR